MNARATLAALIASARIALPVEVKEMYDRASEEALIASARPGVAVEVVLPPPSGTQDHAADVSRLLAGGVRVRYLTAPFIHAKLVAADGALAFVGSENCSATSLDANRELGLMVGEPVALATIEQVFGLDWAVASEV